MLKFLSIATTAGAEFLTADDILHVSVSSGTAAKITLKGGTHYIAVVGTGLTLANFGGAIYDALKVAAVTSWHKPESVVIIPTGVVITSLTVT